ncbi:MAG: hypothetical protein WCH99_19090 [Verrucomicrobiota bacterium]
MKTYHPLANGAPLIIIAACLAARFTSAAEPQIPQQAKVVHARLIPALKPAVREWISQEAKKTSRSSVLSEAAVKADIQTRFAGQSLAGGDIEALILLVMTEAAQDAEKDLEAAMAEMKAANEKKSDQREAANKLKRGESGIKAAARQEYTRPAATNLQVRPGWVKPQSVDQAVDSAKAKLDSKSELGETESLRLQMAMDRLSKLQATLSNLLKKTSETQSNIVNNLK